MLFRYDAEYSKHLDLDDCADHSLMQRSDKQNPKTAQSPSWWANLMKKDKEAGGHYKKASSHMFLLLANRREAKKLTVTLFSSSLESSHKSKEQSTYEST